MFFFIIELSTYGSRVLVSDSFDPTVLTAFDKELDRLFSTFIHAFWNKPYAPNWLAVFAIYFNKLKSDSPNPIIPQVNLYSNFMARSFIKWIKLF